MVWKIDGAEVAIALRPVSPRRLLRTAGRHREFADLIVYLHRGVRHCAPARHLQPTKSYRLQVDHVQAGLNRRFSHPAVEGQDVSRRTRERQCEV